MTQAILAHGVEFDDGETCAWLGIFGTYEDAKRYVQRCVAWDALVKPDYVEDREQEAEEAGEGSGGDEDDEDGDDDDDFDEMDRDEDEILTGDPFEYEERVGDFYTIVGLQIGKHYGWHDFSELERDGGTE